MDIHEINTWTDLEVRKSDRNGNWAKKARGVVRLWLSDYYLCNPSFCVCQDCDSELCIFCEREFLYIQSDNDGISIISEENCSSISSRAGANSCVQSPQQHDHLSVAFGNTVSIANSGGDGISSIQASDDPGAGPSGISRNVGRSRSNSNGNTKGYDRRQQPSSPDPVKRKLSALHNSSNRHGRSPGHSSDEDSNTKQTRQRWGICTWTTRTFQSFWRMSC